MKTALPALVAPASVAFAADDDRAKKDLKSLEGTWEYVSQVSDGKEAEKGKLEGIRLTVTDGGEWQLKQDDAVILEGAGELDPSKEPKAADWTIPSEGALKDEVALGIYEVTRDTWKHCFATEKRQEKFESKEGGRVTYAVLRRVKK